MTKLLVDVLGFAALIPVMLIYNLVEDRWSDTSAVAIVIVLLIPISLTWHHFYRRVRESAPS